MARVFVSHASADAAYAQELYHWLKDDGHDVFLDQERSDGILPGEEWERRLYKELRLADAVVCVVTESYIRSVWCAAEIGAARALGTELLAVQFSASDVRHTLLSPLQGLDAAVDRVEARERLRSRLGVIDGAGGWGWADDKLPYPGLRPFELGDHRVFFGRAREITRITERLRSAERAVPAVLTVVGPSGCGKSSLVRAGVLPRIAGEPNWLSVGPFMPGTDPLGNLVRALADLIRERGIDCETTSLLAKLADRGLGATSVELLLAAKADSQCKLLIVIDQFEELITQTAQPQRSEFAALLREPLGGPVQVLATLRPEFLDAIAKDPDLSRLPRRIHEIRPLESDALRSVVEDPAALAGLRFEDGLVTRVVADTGSGAALPLLAFTLQQLAEGLTRGDILTHRRYDEIGGVQGALQRQADIALEEACATTGESREAVISSLLNLVTIDEQGRPTKRTVTFDELSGSVTEQLRPFITRRLLSTEGSGERATVAVSHEAFLAHWSPLKIEIDRQATALRARRVVENAAGDWVASGRETSVLLQGRQLVKAVIDTGAELRLTVPAGQPHRAARLPTWSDRHHALTTRVDLNDSGREFLDASIRADRTRRRNRLMQYAAVVVLLALISFIAVTFGVRSTRASAEAQRRAQQATASRLENEALAMLSQDRPGGDARAMQQLLAADVLDPGSAPDGLAEAVLRRLTTAKIADAGAGVTKVVVSPDGRRLASMNDENEVQLWSADTADRDGRPLKPPADEQAVGMAFGPGGLRVATRDGSNTVRLYGESGEQITTLRGAGQQQTAVVAFNADTHRVATLDGGGAVRVWNADSGQPLSDPHTVGPIAFSSVALGPDAHRLVTGATDGTVQLWNADTGDPLGPARTGHRGSVRAVAFSRDGQRVASGGADRTVRVWETENDRPPVVFTGHTNRVGSVSFSPDGHRLVSGGTDNTVRVWDLDSAKPIGSPLRGHTDWVQSVAFRDDHRLVSGSADHSVRLWDIEAVAPVAIGPESVGVALNSAGDRVAVAGHDQPVRVRRADTGEIIAQMTGDANGINAMALSSDGHRLAAGGIDGTVQIWNADSGQPVGVLPTRHAAPVGALAFSPAGDVLASAGADRAVLLWNTNGGTFLRALQWADMEPAASVAFSPDGDRVATGSVDGTVALWNAGTGDLIRKFPSVHNGVVRAVTFSDGTDHRLATSGDDQTVRLWDVGGGGLEYLGPFRTSHTDSVIALAFTRDGHRLATGSLDDTVRLWNADTGDPLGAVLTGHTDMVLGVAFGEAGGQRLTSVSRDGTVRIWPTEATVDMVCAKLTRDISRDEWREWVARGDSRIGYRKLCSSLPDQ